MKKDINKINVQNLESKVRDNILDKEVRKQYNNITQQFFDLKQTNHESNQNFQQSIEANMRSTKFYQDSKIEEIMKTMKVIEDQQNKNNQDQRRMHKEIQGMKSGVDGGGQQYPSNRLDTISETNSINTMAN